MLDKIFFSILMLMMSGAGYSQAQKSPSIISKSEWVTLCDESTDEIRYICEVLRVKAKVSRSIFSENWGKTYKKISSIKNLHLEFQNRNISDLTPFAAFNNLTVLNLQGNKISDLSPLSGLENLTIISLKYNQIVDISPLEKLDKLTGLYLTDNSISDLSPLESLKDLEHLYLEQNKIKDLTALDGLTNLHEIRLSNNKISDLTPLDDLKRLAKIALKYNRISDLTPLAGLRNLTNLELSYNKISDLAPLAGLKNLTVLDLDANKIFDLTPLAGLKRITNLFLKNNKISDVTPLANMRDLTALGLMNNQISDFSPIKYYDIGTDVKISQKGSRAAELATREITKLEIIKKMGPPTSDTEKIIPRYNTSNKSSWEKCGQPGERVNLIVYKKIRNKISLSDLATAMRLLFYFDKKGLMCKKTRMVSDS